MPDIPNEVIGLIYRITNSANGKRYVGQTVNTLRRRLAMHVSAAKCGSPYALHAAIRKYGVDCFSITLVERVVGCREALLSAEIRQIQRYRCVAPLGYNLTGGGEGVDFPVPEVRARHLQSVQRSKESDWAHHITEAAQRRAADPEWRSANLVQLQRLHSDPNFRAKHCAAMQRLHAKPEYRQAVQEGLRNKKDPAKWLEGVSKGLEKARQTRTANALLKDTLVSPEEQALRVSRREAVRRCREKKLVSA